MSEYSNRHNFATKYRPLALNEVVGQRHVKAEIRGMIKSGRVPNTIFLFGPTGVGKTTLAYIIADLVNEVEDGEVNRDVIEADMALNGGIDETRNIIKMSKFAPYKKYRVFIIDEIQDASPNAKASLLKATENAPKKTLYIFCTNQPEKLPKTITGRGIKLQLETPLPEETLGLLQRVCKAENLYFGKKHDLLMKKIVNTTLSEPRNALSLLQQIANVNAGSKDPEAGMKLAVTMAGGLNHDSLAPAILAATYSGDCERVIKAVLDVSNGQYFTVLNVMLDVNEYVMANIADVRAYDTPARKKMRDSLKEVPDVGAAILVENALVDMRQQMTTVTVGDRALFLARLSNVAGKIASIKTKKG
jgi:DNA polymerase III gamma/tau subunit